MKKCFVCSIEKPLGMFYKHKDMSDGHLNKCKECTKAGVSKNYRKNIDHYKAYEVKRNKEPLRKKNKLRYQKNSRAKNPDKYFARTMVGNYIRDGKLEKEPCIYCGEIKVEAHHHDYSKPIDVTWVCFSCHRKKEHGQMSF